MYKNLMIDVEAEDRYGNTPLHWAVKRNDFPLVKNLLSRGADVSMENNNKVTPLHEACSANNDENCSEIIDLLLKSEADFEARDNMGQTPLFCLMEKANFEIIKLFLNYKTNFHALDNRGCNLLFPAVSGRDKNPDVVQFLLNLGLDVNLHSRLGTTPLHEAVSSQYESNLEVVEVLLRNGANVNARGRRDETPLFYAVENKVSLKIIKLLLKYKAEVNLVDKKGFSKSLLHRINSLKSKHLKTVKLLLKNGVNINVFDQDKTSVLENYLVIASIKHDKISEEEKKFFLNFIMEHMDFSIVHKNNILNFNQHYLEEMLKIILEFLAKLQSLNIPVNKNLFDTILKHVEYNNYYTRCEKELLLARDTKLGNSWITYYNILTDSRKKLKNYAGNKDLTEDLNKKIHLQNFPIYGTIMYENMQKGIKRRDLLDQAAILLSDYLPIFNPSHLIIRDVLSCILSKKILLKLLS